MQNAHRNDQEATSPTAPNCRLSFFVAWILVALAGLGGMIAFSPSGYAYDEEFHLRGACALTDVDPIEKTRGAGGAMSIREMLVADIASAPGPLYSVLHAALYPLTGFEVPPVRYVNLGLLLLGCGALSFALHRWNCAHPWLLASLLLGLPVCWTVVGLAYTEIPAFSMAALGMAAAAWATTSPRDNGVRCYLGFALAGLFCGLAITGRQTYLPMIGAFIAVALVRKRWRWPACLGFVTATAVVLPMFLAWGGLTRHELQTTMGGGVAFTHGVVAFAWLGLVLALLAPRFFLADARWIFAAAATAAGANLAFVHLEWHIYDGLLAYLPDRLGRPYDPIVGTLLMAAFGAFVVAAGINLWRRRQDGRFVLALGQSMALTATALGIVQPYTPRYVMATFPFVLLVVEPFFVPSRWALLRLSAGCLVGAASLATYYLSVMA